MKKALLATAALSLFLAGCDGADEKPANGATSTFSDQNAAKNAAATEGDKQLDDRIARLDAEQRAIIAEQNTRITVLEEAHVEAERRNAEALAKLKQDVAAALRRGDFALAAESRIVVEAAPEGFVAALSAPQGWAQKLRYATGFKLPVVEKVAPANEDIVLSAAPDAGFLTAAEAATLTIRDGANSYTKPIPDNALNQGYQYNFGPKGAVVRFSSATGGLNGFIALARKIMGDGNLAGKHWLLSKASGIDYPAYESRTIMLDVGRYFMPVEQIIGYMEKMSLFKLNELHMHIQDDRTVEMVNGSITKREGAFRLYSPERPELMPPDKKYYTRDDWDRLEEAAARYGITIFPEFEGPGHARSWLKAYPDIPYNTKRNELDMTQPEKTATIVVSVINHFRPWFRSGIVHLGGDESAQRATDYINILYNKISQSAANPDGFSEVRAWHPGVDIWPTTAPAKAVNPAIKIHHWSWDLWGVNEQPREVVGLISDHFYYLPGDMEHYNLGVGLIAETAEKAYSISLGQSVELQYAPSGYFFANWNDASTMAGITVDMVNSGMARSLPIMGEMTWTGPVYDQAGKRLTIVDRNYVSQAPISQELSSYWLRERFPYLDGLQALNVLMDNSRHRIIDAPTEEERTMGRYADPKKGGFKPGPAETDFMAWDTEDLDAAFNGPKFFRDGMFVADIPGEGKPFTLRPDVICHDPAFVAGGTAKSRCDEDSWDNDIVPALASGKPASGGLLKLGAGKLILAGKNTYIGDTIIEGGTLEVKGSITSKVMTKGDGVYVGPPEVMHIQ